MVTNGPIIHGLFDISMDAMADGNSFIDEMSDHPAKSG
jgi:hypothetical protein